MSITKFASTTMLCPALAGLAVLASIAHAATWPTHQVRAIVPFAAGSAADIVPRIVFERMQDQIGQTIVVENRPGGAGAVGVSAVAKSEPDGHTLLVHSNAFVTAPAIQDMPYDPVRDFAGITPLGNVPLVLVISPAKNIHSLKELVAAAKTAPGSINYAAAGIGSPPHLTAERFRLAAGFQGQLVPFKGAPDRGNAGRRRAPLLSADLRSRFARTRVWTRGAARGRGLRGAAACRRRCHQSGARRRLHNRLPCRGRQRSRSSRCALQP